MKEFKLEINKHLTKWGVRNKILEFLDVYYDHGDHPFIKIKLKNDKDFYGLICGGLIRRHLLVYNLRGQLQALEFKEISNIEILNNFNALQLIAKLIDFIPQKEKIRQINKEFNDNKQSLEKIFEFNF